MSLKLNKRYKLKDGYSLKKGVKFIKPEDRPSVTNVFKVANKNKRYS